MNPRTGEPTALAAATRLLEDLRFHICQHDNALIRIDVSQIDEQLVAERSICEEISKIRDQLGPAPTELASVLHNLRRLLRTHSILIAKSQSMTLALMNTYAAYSGRYPTSEFANPYLSFIDQESLRA